MNIVVSIGNVETEFAVRVGSYGIRPFDKLVRGRCINHILYRHLGRARFSFHGDFPYRNISIAGIRRPRRVDHDVTSDWIGNIDFCSALRIVRNDRRAVYKVPLVSDSGQFSVRALHTARQALTRRNGLPFFRTAAGLAILFLPQSLGLGLRQ